MITPGYLENKLEKQEAEMAYLLEGCIDEFLQDNYAKGKALIYQWPTADIPQNVQNKIKEKYSEGGWQVQDRYGTFYSAGYAWEFKPRPQPVQQQRDVKQTLQYMEVQK